MKAIVHADCIIGDKYRLLRKIGQGGNGCVYVGQDYRLGNYWAIKELPREHEMQLQEVNVLKRLAHPMLPRITDRIEIGDKVYIVMDYLHGSNLEELMGQGRRFKISQIVKWGMELCEVLTYLHEQTPQIIYRDLKPGNIVLTTQGELKLVDFGCACIYSSDDTSKQVYAGSPSYAAPEQFGGESTPLTDIFGLGATLEGLCRGQRIPGNLKRIIRKCKKTSPHQRFQSGDALMRALCKINLVHRKRGRVRKICLVSLAVLALVFVLKEVCLKMQNRWYYEAMEQEEFAQAIQMCPEKELPYQYLLEQYVEQGETKKGMDLVESYRLLYAEETKEHTAILEDIGKLYFSGNVLDQKFGVNYERAYEYFQKIPDKDAQLACYETMAGDLCEFGDEIDWKKVGRNLERLEAYADREEQKEKRIGQYQTIAAVYLGNRQYFEAGSVDGLERGIRLLEVCEELVEESGQRGHYIQLAVEVQMNLADACYMKGMRGNQSFLEKSSKLYQEMLNQLVEPSLRIRVMMNLAYIYQEAGNYENASQWYEKVILENPQEVDGYCLYGLMKLLDQEDMKKAKRLFEEAGKISGAKKNQSYQVLKKRLEVLYEK